MGIEIFKLTNIYPLNMHILGKRFNVGNHKAYVEKYNSIICMKHTNSLIQEDDYKFCIEKLNTFGININMR